MATSSLLFAILSLIAPAKADTPAEIWNAWTRTHDEELRTSPSSLLGVCSIETLGAGDSIFLPVDLKRRLCKWTGVEPAGRHASLAFGYDGTIALVTPERVPVDLRREHTWTSAQGLSVSVDLAKDTGKLRVITRDKKNPPLAKFTRSKFYPYNPQAVVLSSFERLSPPKKTTFEMTRGEPRTVWLVGTLAFRYHGRDIRFDAFAFDPDARQIELVIPFRDAGNGVKSPAAGRVLKRVLDDSGATGVTLDFNRALNSPCERNPVFDCVKTITAQPLDVEIDAGERKP